MMKTFAPLIGTSVLLGMRCACIGVAITGGIGGLIWGFWPLLYALPLCLPLGAVYGLVNGITIAVSLTHSRKGRTPEMDRGKILSVTTLTTIGLSALLWLSATSGPVSSDQLLFIRLLAIVGLPAAVVSALWATNKVLDRPDARPGR